MSEKRRRSIRGDEAYMPLLYVVGIIFLLGGLRDCYRKHVNPEEEVSATRQDTTFEVDAGGELEERMSKPPTEEEYAKGGVNHEEKPCSDPHDGISRVFFRPMKLKELKKKLQGEWGVPPNVTPEELEFEETKRALLEKYGVRALVTPPSKGLRGSSNIRSLLMERLDPGLTGTVGMKSDLCWREICKSDKECPPGWGCQQDLYECLPRSCGIAECGMTMDGTHCGDCKNHLNICCKGKCVHVDSILEGGIP